jgi:hypothetical protein
MTKRWIMERSLGKLALAAAGALTILCPAWAAAADRDVRVINTTAEAVPVTVQGTATVTGGVQVTNTPTVGLDPSQNRVTIANATSHPVPVAGEVHVRSPLPQPLSMTVFGTLASAGGYYLENWTYTVPAGKQAVITYVGIKVRVPVGSNVQLEYKTLPAGGSTLDETTVTMNPKKVESLVFVGYEDWFDTQFPQIYLSAGTTLRGTAYADASGSGQLYLSGYLVDAP